MTASLWNNFDGRVMIDAEFFQKINSNYYLLNITEPINYWLRLIFLVTGLTFPTFATLEVIMTRSGEKVPFCAASGIVNKAT